MGKIRPIVVFDVEGDVGEDGFRRLVWGSSYSLYPEGHDEPYYAEDWNGYTSVLEARVVKEWTRHLKKNNCYSGKVFSKEDLQGGISAVEMGLVGEDES